MKSCRVGGATRKPPIRFLASPSPVSGLGRRARFQEQNRRPFTQGLGTSRLTEERSGVFVTVTCTTGTCAPPSRVVWSESRKQPVSEPAPDHMRHNIEETRNEAEEYPHPVRRMQVLAERCRADLGHTPQEQGFRHARAWPAAEKGAARGRRCGRPSSRPELQDASGTRMDLSPHLVFESTLPVAAHSVPRRSHVLKPGSA